MMSPHVLTVLGLFRSLFQWLNVLFGHWPFLLVQPKKEIMYHDLQLFQSEHLAQWI